MSRIVTGDRTLLNGPRTTVSDCTVGSDGVVTAMKLHHIKYHRGGPRGEPVFVLGRNGGGEDLIATDVLDLDDLETAIERSGRVEPKAISVGAEAEPVVVEVVRTR